MTEVHYFKLNLSSTETHGKIENNRITMVMNSSRDGNIDINLSQYPMTPHLETYRSGRYTSTKEDFDAAMKLFNEVLSGEKNRD